MDKEDLLDIIKGVNINSNELSKIIDPKSIYLNPGEHKKINREALYHTWTTATNKGINGLTAKSMNEYAKRILGNEWEPEMFVQNTLKEEVKKIKSNTQKVLKSFI